MKRRRDILLLAAVAIVLSGCQYLGVQPPERPVDRYSMAVDSYTMAMDTAISLYDGGYLDADDLRDVYAVSRIARGALDQWALALEESRDPEAARERFNDALTRMRDIIDAESEEVDNAPE